MAGLGRRVVSSAPIAATNNNNRLFRLEMADGPPLLAKLYYRDGRRRLEREFDALTLLAERGFPNVPRPVARDDEAYWAVYTFERGAVRPPETYTADDVRALALFAAELHRIPPCDEVEDVHSSTDMLARGQHYFTHAPDHLRLEVEPLLALAPTRERPPRERLRLVHGDFAPHNILFGGGDFAVVDWEGAGWDDPAVLPIEFVLHEATRGLTRPLQNLFLETYLEQHPDADLAHWRDVYRFMQISWALGFLGVFDPAYVARKRFANPDLDVTALQADRVAKLRARLETVVDSPPDPLIS